MDIPAQSKTEETSFLVSCNGSCDGIDIKVKGNPYRTEVELFALEEEKPTIDIDDASCVECETFCSSRNTQTYRSEKTCENLSTSSDRFFVTVYARYSHEDLTITFSGGNILNITQIGKKFEKYFINMLCT